MFPGQPWPPLPASPGSRRRGGVLAAVITSVIAAIVLLCGGSIYALSHSGDRSHGGAGDDYPFTLPSGFAFPTDDPSGNPFATPSATSTEPQPSVTAAKDIYDLDQVCDANVYFPDAPKRAGKAPHPVVLLVKTGPDDVRSQDPVFYLQEEGTAKSDENTWAARGPGKVQMAACMDRTTEGKKIRTCKYTDPDPETVTLYHASWRLRVYEVATHRLLLDKKLEGTETACPFSVFVGKDKKIYAKVSDHTALGALRNLVEK
ncbi:MULTISPECIES: hypothetical protein [unclassified Actinoplanes]|uniref:hypothetical protein n=1 Tax=unclassified Actinoplanes TaxID=2626549 RepID=UPI0002E320FC|nr:MULTISPECIES: hypothetical protein [unclassified Actinoplanes]